MQRSIRSIASALALLLGAASPMAQGDEYWPTQGWRIATPESQGMDSGVLADALDAVRDRGTPIHSVTIVRNGYVVLDTAFWPYRDGQLHDVASVTKSVTTTLTGIAIGRGMLTGMSQTLPAIFEGQAIANLDERKRRLTLGQLAAMASGLDCKSRGEATLGEMRQRPDWTQFMLDLPMREEPGSHFEYCSGGMHLLSAALTKATGLSALDYARRELFAPLGIAQAQWPADTQGVSHGWGDLRLAPRDMAKLGYLWLKNGRWQDRQLVPEQWMRAAVAVQSRPGYGSGQYGYGFWVSADNQPMQYEALGRGGQRITVVPEKDIVVVFTGGGFEPGEFGDFIGRALKADAPLPDNPAATQRLADAIKLAAAPPMPTHYVSPLARTISGQRYALAANPIGLTALRLRFPKAGAARLELTLGQRLDGPRPVGLDGIPRLSPGGPSGMPVAVRGAWESEQVFVLDYDEVGAINAYRLRLRFTGKEIEVAMSERTGSVPDARFAGMAVD